MGRKLKDNLSERDPVTLHVSASKQFFETATFPGAEESAICTLFTAMLYHFQLLLYS